MLSNRFSELEHVVGVVICAGAVEEELDGSLGLRCIVTSDVSEMHNHHTSACDQHQYRGTRNEADGKRTYSSGEPQVAPAPAVQFLATFVQDVVVDRAAVLGPGLCVILERDDVPSSILEVTRNKVDESHVHERLVC